MHIALVQRDAQTGLAAWQNHQAADHRVQEVHRHVGHHHVAVKAFEAVEALHVISHHQVVAIHLLDHFTRCHRLEISDHQGEACHPGLVGFHLACSHVVALLSKAVPTFDQGIGKQAHSSHDRLVRDVFHATAEHFEQVVGCVAQAAEAVVAAGKIQGRLGRRDVHLHMAPSLQVSQDAGEGIGLIIEKHVHGMALAVSKVTAIYRLRIASATLAYRLFNPRRCLNRSSGNTLLNTTTRSVIFMLINNVRRFLTTAVIVACASMSAYVSADVSLAPNVGKDEVTSSELGKMPYLSGVDVEGRSVRLIPEGKMPIAYQIQLQAQTGGGAMKFDIGNQSYCAVTIQDNNSDGMVNRHYMMRSNDDAENIFMQANVNQFYLAAHELSHCFNNSTSHSVEQLLEIKDKKGFSGYAEPLAMLEISMRETYADLSAIMLGASKTGDWTVFTDGVMPYRTGQLDTTHMTINALTTIISKVDPRMVKGMNFSEVNVLVNDLFQSNFMNADHQIDLNSVGVRRIAQEMEFVGERLRLYARMKDVDKTDAHTMVTKANLMRGFTRAVYGQKLGNATDFALLTALQIVDAQDQLALAADTQLTEKSFDWVLHSVNKGSTYRQRVSRVFYDEMSKDLSDSANLDRQVGIVSAWKSQVRSELSAPLLNDSLKTLVAQGTVQGIDPTQDSVRNAVAQSIKHKLNVLRTGIVSAAANPSSKVTLRETSAPGLD